MPAVGSDVFKFLASHSSGPLGSDFKHAVRSKLGTGQPISVELKLYIQRSMGFESYVLHWTPLKDEHGNVRWIVLTLGRDQRVGLG